MRVCEGGGYVASKNRLLEKHRFGSLGERASCVNDYDVSRFACK